MFDFYSNIFNPVSFTGSHCCLHYFRNHNLIYVYSGVLFDFTGTELSILDVLNKPEADVLAGLKRLRMLYFGCVAHNQVS